MKGQPHEYHEDEDEPDRERQDCALVLPQSRLVQLFALIEEQRRYEQQHEQFGICFYDGRYRQCERHYQADCYLHEWRGDVRQHPVQESRHEHRCDQHQKKLQYRHATLPSIE